jgi:TonB-linked SusC/RagA family outer membrane protein
MKKYLFIIIAFLCTGVIAQAQQKLITGTINGTQGAIAGASVYEKELNTNGTVSDASGKFQLTLKGKSNTIVIGYIGYISQEIAIGNRTSVAVNLAVDAKGLEDVVVVGYGTQKKITNTGAVSSINGNDIRQTPTASIQNSLMGRVPGFISQQRSGKPGSDGAAFLIRGLSTPNGTGQPLIVVDDVEYTGPMNEIDPDQVETLSILKDAATTAIYGVKGANGVIVITTRRGKTGQAAITFRSEAGLQIPVLMPKYVSAYDAARLTNQAIDGDIANGASPTRARFTDADIEAFKNGSDPYGHPNINWTKMLIRPYTIATRNNLNIQGGADRLKYFISAGHLWQNGLLKGFDDPNSGVNTNYYYKRYNFRSNIDYKATKSLDLRLDLSGAFAETNEPNIGGRDNRNNIFFELSDFNQLPPFAYAPYNPNGSYGANPSNTNYRNNVIGRIALGGYNRSFDNDMTANLRATQRLDFITKGLSVWANLSYNSRFRFWRSLTRPGQSFPSYGYNNVTGAYTPLNANVYRIEKYQLGYYADGPNSYKRLNYQAAINYDRTFSKHHLSALVLANPYKYIYGTGTPTNFLGLTSRIGYDFERRYLLEVSAGYNGSDRFPKGKRYGLFPAVSVGWNLGEENFFKNNITFIELFKFRASYGLTGSDDVGGNQYIYIQNYIRNNSTNNNYSIGETPRAVTGITEGTLGNNVTWEKQREWNIGVDITALKGKLTITADVFNKHRYDILQARGTVSNIIGVGLPPANLWIVDNKGFELAVGYKNSIKKFNYFVNANITGTKNSAVNRDEATPAYPWLALTNKPLGTILGYTTLGFYTKEDIADPKVAKPSSGTTGAGDLKYLDRNRNGVIDADDRTTLEYPNLPNTILGFTTGFTYRGFSLTATLQSALNFGLRGVSETANPFQNNFREIHLGAWRPDNAENPTFPRITTIPSTSHPLNYPSDYWFIRGDYLRLKTAEIGYALPANWVKKIRFKNARIYANGYNLFTIALVDKNIYDIDPENTSGTDGVNFYPQQKVINFGLQFTF